MDNERVAMIRALLDHKDALDKVISEQVNNPDAEPRYLRQLKSRYQTDKFEIKDNAEAWLRDLLAENARLQRLVDAGERLYEAVLEVSNPSPQFHRETQEALLPALAMYEVNTLPDIAE